MGERGATEVIDGSGREGSDGGYRRQWERGARGLIDRSGREENDGGYRR